MAAEVFISYRRADQGKARLLHALLKQRGLNAWYDGLLSPGDDWRKKTAQALEDAPIFVLMFSKVASESDDISKELAAATFSKKLVIPVRIENIKPSGAFLYELASRNWIDAYDDTEARLTDLADQLAAIVRGGADADVAAFHLGSPQPAPAIQRVQKPPLKNPVVLSLAALAAVAVAAVFGFMAMRPQTPPPRAAPASQRVAFFGFSSDGADATAMEMARTATDETFSTLDAMSLQTVARGITEGTPAAKQLDQAKALGARYSVGGEVRKQGETYVVSIRLDDALLGSALWQKTLPSGTAAQKVSLPVQAAAEATRAAQCFANYRPELPPETERVLTLLRRICANPSLNPELIGALRELSQLAPHSALIQGQFAGFQLATLTQLAPAERAARFEEARQTIERVRKFAPDNPWNIQAEAFLGYASGRPFYEIDALLRSALARNPDAFILLVAYRDLLTAAGRQKEALDYADRARQRNPLNTTANWTTALLMFQTGRISEGYSRLETLNARFPSPLIWQLWVFAAANAKADVKHALEARPASVSGETFECVRDVAVAIDSKLPAVRSKGAARLRACVAVKAISVSQSVSLEVYAALGDVDGAFELVQKDRTLPLDFLSSTNAAFFVAARPMREGSRFKQLTVDQGLWQYWLDTKTMPDVCSGQERSLAFCRELRDAELAK